MLTTSTRCTEHASGALFEIVARSEKVDRCGLGAEEQNMNGDLGQPIGYGRTAEIYAWQQGQVLKLL